MDRTQKLAYQKEVETYLEKNRVYDIFENLMKDLVISQPAQPLDYLINKLQQPQQRRVFVVGPPGSKTTELALQLANEFRFTCVSVGNLLKKQISMKNALGEEIENAIKSVGYVRDETVIDIVKAEIDELEKKKQNYFLEGFPKTRVQALALQRTGIIPDTFIVLNKDAKGVVQSCLSKIKLNQDGHYSKIASGQWQSLADNHALEYTMNLNHVKEAYARHFFEVDANSLSAEAELPEEMARLLEFKIRPKGPKRSARIVVMGPPGSGRSTLAKQLSKKYGLVYISTQELISDQIAKKSEVGKVALNLVKNGDLVPDEIINGLVGNRVKQPDCHLQGYVLDGYPKTVVQLLCLVELNINPTLLVELECPNDLVLRRFREKKIDPITGEIYDKMNPCTNSEAAKRLQENPNDTQEIVQRRYLRWKELLKSIEQSYSHLILKVSSNLPPKNVLEKVAFHLENTA